MPLITLDLPDELAERLRSQTERLPQILAHGLRELSAAAQNEFHGASDVLELLAALPSPEEILAMRPSRAFTARVSELLEKNRTGGLSPDEEVEWQQYEYLEHLVRLAKAKAASKQKAA